MHDLAIQVQGLSKQYVIGQGRDRHETLRDHLAQSVERLLRWDVRRRRPAQTIWALHDVSFDVRRGEVVGIVGRNGAGKSTLLKILARITEPTGGGAEIRGRVASLLEVGTGFHPELTGRENIYLNGAILGMRKAEIDHQRDAIIAFSGVEPFIDTPVKRYSSGMQTRLAFAVAAHLRPEILLVDEVLAVGDADFQRKCLGKMEDVAREGRTVVFVSHNLGAITQLCPRALWIDGGGLRLDGPGGEVVEAYLQSTLRGSPAWEKRDGEAGARLGFRSVRVLGANQQPAAVVPFNAPFKIEIGYELATPLRDLSVICRVNDAAGNTIWTSWDTDVNGRRPTATLPGRYRSVCTVPAHLLRPGTYYVFIGAHSGREWFTEDGKTVTFEVSHVGYNLNPGRMGLIAPLLAWDTYGEEKELAVEGGGLSWSTSAGH